MEAPNADTSPTTDSMHRIGDHILIAGLGQGGMANVHLAVKAGPAGFNKLLVIKTLRPDVLEENAEMVKMFLDEARLAARLNHKNVVQTYEVGETDGLPFISMEYLEGQCLRHLQRRLGTKNFPLPAQLQVLAQTARGLNYAHNLADFDGTELRVVHRDVSPQNVFVGYDGQVKLLDFGIAKAAISESLTKVGQIKGKVDYIAPEQLRGEAIDGRADIFALGAMLYEAVAGEAFSGGKAVPQVTRMTNRVAGREKPIREVCPDAPDKLVEIIERAIAIDRDDRYATGEDFARDIEAYLASTGEQVSAQTLGDLVCPAFAKERSDTRRVIDEKMREIKELRSGEIKLANLANATGEFAAVSGTHSLSPDHRAEGAPPASQKAWQRYAAVAAVLLIAGGAALFANHRQHESERLAAEREAAAVAAAAAAKIATAPKPAPAPEMITLTGDITPANASVVVDGKSVSLEGGLQLPKDHSLHRVVISAPGYQEHSLALTFNQSRSIHVQLATPKAETADAPRAQRRRPRRGSSARRAPPVATAQGGAATAAASPEPASAPARAPAKAEVADMGFGADLTAAPTRRVIDEDDPYD